MAENEQGWRGIEVEPYIAAQFSGDCSIRYVDGRVVIERTGSKPTQSKPWPANQLREPTQEDSDQ